MSKAIRREDLVGTIFTMSGKEVILTDLVGEGAENVIYAIAPIESLKAGSTVLRFKKPQSFLEMRTLHHLFRVHEELYPDHPLRMSEEDRMRSLADEMCEWIEDERAALRVRLFHELYDATFSFLGNQVASEPDTKMALVETLNRGGVPRLLADQNFIDRIRELQDEDLIEHEYVDYAGVLEQTLAASIARWQAEGTYTPLSRSAICLLLGFCFEGYLSREEAASLAQEDRIVIQTTERDLTALCDLIEALTSRAHVARERAVSEGHERGAHEVVTVIKASDYLYTLAESRGASATHFRGQASYFLAVALGLVKGHEEERRQWLRASLDDLDGQDLLEERHNALQELALSYSDEDHPERQACIAELLEIRTTLGLE